MLAIYLGLQTFLSKKERLHIRIMCHNVLSHMILHECCQYSPSYGYQSSDQCNELAKLIKVWCIDRKIWLSTAHIPGEKNIVADVGIT